MLTFRKPVAASLDRRGYYRSPVTMPAYRKGHPAPNKGRKFPPEPLKPREILALLDQCGRGYAGMRDRALITLLWRTGLRCAEALALLPKDIDVEAGTVHVLHGKGDKERTVAIDRMACAVVTEWLAKRKELGVTGRQPIFCVISTPTRGEPMHSAQFRNRLKQLGERAGIERRVHPHGLRHTHAFELAGEGVDLRLIQQQLGHTELAVTARYVNHLNPAALVATLRERDWPDEAAIASPTEL